MEKTFEDLLMDIKATGEEINAGESTDEGNVTPQPQGEEETGSGDEGDALIVPSGDEEQGTGDSADAQGAEESLEGDADQDGEEDEVTLDLDEDEFDLIELEEEDDETPAPAPEAEFIETVKDVVGEDISTTDQLKEYVQSLKEEVSTLKERVSENPLENIPEQLKEAVEYAKEGKADYLELLEITSIDYTKLDPVTLAENDIKQYFYDSQGNFDEDGFIDYVDNVPEKELEIRGMQRINQLVGEQNAQKANFLAKRDAEVRNENAAIQNAISRMDAVGVFKVKESDKQKLINSMVNGNYKNVFIPKNETGQVDFAKVAEDLFIRNNYEKMVNVLKTQTRNSVKEEVIKNIGNQTVGANPDVGAHTPEGVVDPLDAMIEGAKKNSEASSLNTFYQQINNNK